MISRILHSITRAPVLQKFLSNWPLQLFSRVQKRSNSDLIEKNKLTSVSPLQTYTKIYKALEEIDQRGLKLGNVVNSQDLSRFEEYHKPHLLRLKNEDREEQQKIRDEAKKEYIEKGGENWEDLEEEDEDQIINDYYAKKLGDNIAKAIESLYTYRSYAIGGSMENYHTPHLIVLKNEKEIDCGDLNQLDIEKLLELGTVAPFGDLATMATKVDTNVRMAFDIPLENVFLRRGKEYFKPEEAMEDLKSDINEKLLEGHIKLIPYKLNIYPKGGCFRPHVDTQRKANMIGSLVVCLPTEFEGGDLIVIHKGATFEAKKPKKGQFSWTAFYSDCVHEVKEVTRGARVTMTFLILSADKDDGTFQRGLFYRQTEQDQKSSSLESDAASEKIEKVKQSIVESEFSQIGIIGDHKYTSEGLNACALKGIDKRIFEDLAADPRFDCAIVPVARSLYLSKENFEGGERENDTLIENVFRLTEEDLDFMTQSAEIPRNGMSDSIPFFEISPGQLLMDRHQDGAERTGNEFLADITENLYFSAAILVTKKKQV